MAGLNEKYYSGTDLYSDGDIEEDILRYIQEHEPESYEDVIAKDPRFPVAYHLSEYRQHLLDWYPFSPDASLLEIGGGMGAFTNLFCERCSHVVTIEMSKRRAEAIQSRCRNQNNLDIYVGDLMDIDLKEKFDYITVLGVLEYQKAYSQEEHPEKSFLDRLVTFLKPGGKILIAIENRMGLKYWCGDVEDHCGIPFTGINGYAPGGRARTFDREELSQLLRESALSELKYYYPLPDYKFPRAVYTDDYVPKDNVLSAVIPNYYAGLFHSQYSVVADEKKIYPSIARNGVFPYFANSFFVECSRKKMKDNGIRFVSTTAERREEYKIRTVVRNQEVIKEAVLPAGKPHIEQIYQRINEIKEAGVSIIDHQWDDGKIHMPFIQNQTLEDVLIQLIEKKETAKVQRWIDLLLEQIITASCARQEEKITEGPNMCLTVLSKAYCDMIFSNAFVLGEQLYFYDQEWISENVPANFVLYRAFKILYSANPHLEDAIPQKYWLDLYKISERCEEYDQIEDEQFSKIQSDAVCGFIAKLRYLPAHTIDNNIRALTEANNRIEDLSQQLEAYKRGYIQRDTDVHTLETALSEQGQQMSKLTQTLEEKQHEMNNLQTRISRIEKMIPYRMYRKAKKLLRIK